MQDGMPRAVRCQAAVILHAACLIMLPFVRGRPLGACWALHAPADGRLGDGGHGDIGGYVAGAERARLELAQHNLHAPIAGEEGRTGRGHCHVSVSAHGCWGPGCTARCAHRCRLPVQRTLLPPHAPTLVALALAVCSSCPVTTARACAGHGTGSAHRLLSERAMIHVPDTSRPHLPAREACATHFPPAPARTTTPRPHRVLAARRELSSVGKLQLDLARAQARYGGLQHVCTHRLSGRLHAGGPCRVVYRKPARTARL